MYMWPRCWEKLKAGGEGDDKAWDGWMSSLILWTWVWANSGSWWWTGEAWCAAVPWGRKELETTEWLNWTELREYSTSNLCTGRSLKINFTFGFCVQYMSRFLLFPRVSSLPSVFMSFSYHLAYFMVTFSLGGIFGHKVPHPIFKRGQEVANYICWKPSVCQVLWHMDCLVWCSQNLWAIHDSNCLFYFQSSLHRALYCPGGFVYCPV